MIDRPRLTPEQVAGRAFPTSFRGFDQSEVRAFLAAVAEDLRAAAEAGELRAADIIAQAEERSAALLAEAQDEARRVRGSLDAERERAFAEGAVRADDLILEAERIRGEAEAAGGAEAERLIAEAKAVRERILGDLARRRATLREQVEQLHAARERLLGALADLRGQVDGAASELRSALPEAKAAADAAARRVASEPLPSTEQLEDEIAALRAAGFDLGDAEPQSAGAAAEAPTDTEAGAADAPDADGDDSAPAESEAAAAPEANGSTEPGREVVERRSATVRVFRTRRDPTPAIGLAEPELHEVDPAAPFEEVRLVADDDADDVEPEGQLSEADVTAAVEPDATAAPEVASTEEGADVAPSGPPPPAAIDELFARLKAGRDERKATAKAVLDAPVDAAAPAPEPEPAPAEVEPAVEPEPVETAEAGPDANDTAELARRDTALGPARDALAKRLKRQLADEQNEVLDSLRRGDTRPFVIADADDHAASWSLAAARDLAGAAELGASFEGGEPGPISATEVTVVAGDLADAFARPLRTKVLEAIDAADGDRDAGADAVRAVYRDRRGRRLEDAVEHALLDAFATGVLSSAPVGAEFRWVVDDGDSLCPDCDDNALAGAVTGGSAFPTGHVRPPAHPGCRCLLVRARAS